MFEGYRFISARSLLGLSRLDRCQDLPQRVWSPVGQFWLFKIAPQRGFNIATYTLNSLTSFAIYPFYLSLLAMLAIAYYFLTK
jgi:hypothetical protein